MAPGVRDDDDDDDYWNNKNQMLKCVTIMTIATNEIKKDHKT